MSDLLKRIFLAGALLGLLATTGCRPGTLDRYVDLKAHRLLSQAERLYREAERLDAAGKKAEAILTFRQVYEVDPAYLPGLRRLAAAYQAQDRKRLAAYFHERLLALSPADRGSAEALVMIYDSLGQHAQANQWRSHLGEAPLPAPTAQTGTAAQRLSTIWETFLEEQAISGLDTGDGSVYVTTQGGSLFALSQADGQVRWQFSASKPILSRPVFSAGNGQDLVLLGAEDHKLYALSVADGTELWHFQAAAPIHGWPAASGDMVYFGSTDGHLYAVRRDTGEMVWQFATGGAVQAAPLVVGDAVYFGSLDEHIYALNARTGAFRWKFAAVAGVESTPALAGERLFVGANDSRLYCLHPISGRELWRYSTGDAIYSQPLPAGEQVYVTSAGRAALALVASTGKLAWRYDATTFLTAAPAYDRDTLYLVANGSPFLQAIDAQTGSLLWSMDTGDWPTADLLIHDGMLFLGEKDGTVIAYKLP